MLRIFLIAGVLFTVSHDYPALAASASVEREATIIFCSDAGRGDCRSAPRTSKQDWLFAESAGVLRTTNLRDANLHYKLRQTHIASASQPSSVDATKTSPIKKESPAGFVFDANSVRHSKRLNLFIRIGEKMSRQALKRRFAGYDVRYAEGEGCLVCTVITGPDGQFDVDFEQDGRTVTHLRSTDNRIRDIHGNEIGLSLKSALGTEFASCDAGESTTCAFPSLKGLSYIVMEDDRCAITVHDKRPTKIPVCARIGGFQVLSTD